MDAGWNTTKIHRVVMVAVFLVEFEITSGEVSDGSIAPQLIARLLDVRTCQQTLEIQVKEC
ncbi:hypothetical protein ATY38_03860 [Nitrosomonas ureae]|nr:hypothetical protein ATY38_03860 [Nitrosomonas ureae]